MSKEKKEPKMAEKRPRIKKTKVELIARAFACNNCHFIPLKK